MTANDDKVRELALQAACAVLADFHSQPSISPLETQLTGRHAFLQPLLWLLGFLRRSRLGITLILGLGLLGVRRRWFAADIQPLYVVSLTPNNDRILTQLGDVLRAAGLPFMPNRQPMPLTQRLRLLTRCIALARLLHGEGDTRAFVFLHQIWAAIYVIVFDADLTCAQPVMVVAANDHSPPTVALFGLARVRGLRSCYVQHGPVTPSFPPLSTDLALLFCTQAAESYQAAAQARGQHSDTEVLIFPAMLDPCLSQRAPARALHVCIALSFFTDLAQLTALLTTLRAQSTVRDIMISQHPRSTQNLRALAQREGVRLLPVPTAAKEIAPQADICIVGNSGVALEFLHYGCPTFYLSPPETELDDYYGFVQTGILPRFTPDVIMEPGAACAFFDDDWRRAMGHVDPLFTQNPVTLQHAVITRFRALLQSTTSG